MAILAGVTPSESDKVRHSVSSLRTDEFLVVFSQSLSIGLYYWSVPSVITSCCYDLSHPMVNTQTRRQIVLLTQPF